METREQQIKRCTNELINLRCDFTDLLTQEKIFNDILLNRNLTTEELKGQETLLINMCESVKKMGNLIDAIGSLNLPFRILQDINSGTFFTNE